MQKIFSYILILITILLTILPITAQAVNTVDYNTTGSFAQQNATATWSELTGSPYATNITLTTQTGLTTITASFESDVNYTTTAFQARILKNGSEIARYNITQLANVKFTNSFILTQPETTGLKSYALEVFSTSGRQARIYKYNFSVLYQKAGNYLTTTDNTYFRQFWQGQGTNVNGTWGWYLNAGQTDYASLKGEGAGAFRTNVGGDLEEYKWSNIYLSAGNYTLKTIVIKNQNAGIIEYLFGNTTLGLVDLYNPSEIYNIETNHTFTISSPTTADLRLRTNGKNAASAGYYVPVSRIQLEKTG